jgi:DNA topoisomerase-1
VEAVKAVAGRLGNKPSTCRKYYIHPAVLASYPDGSLFETITWGAASAGALRREEIAVLKLVQAVQVDSMIAA